MHWWNSQGHGCSPKITPLTHAYYHAELGFSRSNHIGISGGFQKFGCTAAGHRELWRDYHCKSTHLLHVTMPNLGTQQRWHNNSQKMTTAGFFPSSCVANLLQIRPSPHGYYAKFDRCLTNGTSVSRDLSKKTASHRSVTQGHQNWHGSIECLRLPINVPY